MIVSDLSITFMKRQSSNIFHKQPLIMFIMNCTNAPMIIQMKFLLKTMHD